MDNNYPEYILRKLRQRADLDSDNDSMDDRFNELSPSEAFAEVCAWEGLRGWDETVKGWIESIYGFDIDDMVK